MFPVRKLRAQDIPATAALLAAAFADNPCYAFMHPGGAHDSPRRVDDLRAFFVRNLEWHLPLDLTWVACLPSGEPAGTVTLEPPAGLPTPLWGTLRHWVLPTLREQGLEGLRRILITDGEFRTAYRALCGEPRYWHVHAVAVAPEQQRAGIGGHMLNFVLERLEEQLLDAPAPVVLSTQREVNVGLYRRFGFELVTQQRLGQQRGQVGYPTWFMLHPRLSRTGPAL